MRVPTVYILTVIIIFFLKNSGAQQLKLRLQHQSIKKFDFTGYIIWIKDVTGLEPIPHQNITHDMNQINKTFSPNVITIRRNDYVNFENLDLIFHNVFSITPGNKFDLGVFKKNQAYTDELKKDINQNRKSIKQFTEPGKINVFCNIHPKMTAVIYVFDHGYYSSVDMSGLFYLPKTSTNKSTIVVDGPHLKKPQEHSIEFKKDQTTNIILKVKKKKMFLKHKRKDGSSYKSKLNIDDLYYS